MHNADLPTSRRKEPGSTLIRQIQKKFNQPAPPGGFWEVQALILNHPGCP